MKARDILIKHNLRLVAHIAKKYNNYKDQDELISIGSLGLIKGIESYNLEKGNKLTTYCSRCIENEILMAMRSQKKYINVVSLYDPIGVDKEGNEMTYIDILKQDEDIVYKNVENEMVHKLLIDTMDKKLDEREKQILILRYGLLSNDPLTQQDVAKQLNISRSYVSRLEKRALKALRGAIDKSIL